MEGEPISQEERKRLDRQRFIGWETQKKLLNSRVLITPANGPNTELAKNLILAGVNVSLFDSSISTEDDFESNFLIAESDIGKSRGQSVFSKLTQMNPTGKNTYEQIDLLSNPSQFEEQWYKKYTIIVTSTGNFQLSAKWDTLTKKLNIPYYNLVCCGLHGFAFISLGRSFTYRPLKKDQKSQEEQKIVTIQSLGLQECCLWGGASKNKEFIAAISMIRDSQSQGLIYDPFSEDQNTLEKIIELGLPNVEEKHKDFLTTFARTYNVDYCPVYSVLGSIVSQEIIKIAQNRTEPGVNWLVFNSESGYANIVNMKSQQAKITTKNDLQ